MESTKVIDAVIQRDSVLFVENWKAIKNSISEKEKQDLLVKIVDEHFRDREFQFFKKILDEIIDSKVSLDFNIDHWPPTFLSLAIFKGSVYLFDYLIRKGANVNFVGNRYAFEDDAESEPEPKDVTCLDFAYWFSADLNREGGFPRNNLSVEEIDALEEKEVVLSKDYYRSLVEQSEHLRLLVNVDDLITRMRHSGAKTFDEIVEERNLLIGKKTTG